MLGQFDTAAALSLEAEIALGKQNPFELRNLQFAVRMVDGRVISEPTSVLQPYMEYIRTTLSTTMDVGAAYDQKPEHLSKRLYDTHDLWHLLMDLNGAPERRFFLGPKFLVLNPAQGTQFKRLVQVARAKISKTAAPVQTGDLTVREVPYT